MTSTTRALVALVACLWAPVIAAQTYMVAGQRPAVVLTTTWTSVASLISANDTAASTTSAMVVTGVAHVGQVVVCVIGKDETGSGTTDGTGNAQYTSIADTAGNTWTEDIEWCNMQTSTAANGACVAVYHSKVTKAILPSHTLTVTYSASTTADAMSCWVFSANGSISLASGSNGLANDAADPGAMTDATGSATEHLFIRASACEDDVTTYTADSDYTTFSHTGSTSDTGAAAVGMGVRGEFRIATESTSASSDPTYSATDCASAMVALNE